MAHELPSVCTSALPTDEPPLPSRVVSPPPSVRRHVDNSDDELVERWRCVVGVVCTIVVLTVRLLACQDHPTLE
jgi:hypothetical protein